MFEPAHPGDRRLVGHFHHLVDQFEGEARLDARPADALDAGGAVRDRVTVERGPAARERRTLRIGDAQAGGQAQVAQEAPDGAGRPAGACTADDPVRRRDAAFPALADDGLGNVVVAAPVGGAAGQPELVQVAGAEPPSQRTGMVGGILAGFEQLAATAQVDDLALLGERRGPRHHRDEGNAQPPGEPCLGDGGAAGRGIDRRLALAQLAVA